MGYVKQTLYYIVVALEYIYNFALGLLKKFWALKFRYKATLIIITLLIFDTLRGYLFGFIVWVLMLTI